MVIAAAAAPSDRRHVGTSPLNRACAAPVRVVFALRDLIRGSARNNAPGFVCRGHVEHLDGELPCGNDMAPRFPNTTEPHGPHRSCDGRHTIIDYREDCDRQHSRETVPS
jgi:hypothetical protein